MTPVSGLKRFSLRAFRSHDLFLFEASEPQSVILLGPNGVGKTNILEALSLLSPGRGLRYAPIKDLQKRTEGGPVTVPWGFSATLAFGGQASPEADVVIQGERSPATEKRITLLNESPLKSATTLIDYLNVLWLTPQMDGLFLAGGTAKRRFLDRLVMGFSSAYGTRRVRYEKALQERHRLLAMPHVSSQWFQGVEAVVAQEGLWVVKERAQFVDQLNAFLNQELLHFPAAHLTISGEVETWAQTQTDAEVEDKIRQRLEKDRGLHRLHPHTPVGPHRSQVEVLWGKTTPAHVCSTGQQKILLIALLVGVCRLHRHAEPEKPLLFLLDDVAAHLDSAHREGLFSLLQDLKIQAWASGTDEILFKGMTGDRVFLK